MITQLKFVGIPVADQDRALAFYRDRLGFEVQTDQPMGPGQRWIKLRVPGAATGIVLFTPEGQEDRVGTFFNGAWACSDVEATWRELSARGVEFIEPPVSESWGTYAKFRDTEGNTFVLSSAD